MIDKLLSARLDDALKLSRKAPHFIGFLDPGEKTDVSEYLSHKSNAYMFYGGYPEAERCFVGFFPDYLDPSEDYFPLSPVTVTFDKRYELSHRDFLGSFMAQGIVRAGIGDILIEQGKAVVFVRDELADYLIDNIFKIGKVGVTLTPGLVGELPESHSFQDITSIIASERIDCAVAGLCGLSREKSAQAIRQGFVQLNYRECLNVSESLSEGDVISVRGKGKFVIDSLDGRTKKGRLVLKGRKYK
ncbi:MAG: YlmH/Sll1252 family protein [Clostridia bacterium]|nr:YlmH/Sll1252 family protein [Clostridia bacterium]